MKRYGLHLRLGIQLCFARVEFLLRARLLQSGIIGAAVVLSAALASATPLATTTTLTTTASPVNVGTVITLTATVVDSNSNSVLFGTINFYDASATPTLIGTAQLPTSGQAVIKLKLAAGSHSLTAVFVATTADLTSTSAAQVMVVTGGSYATTSALASSGSNAIYTLTGTVEAFGQSSPTGTIQFQDTSNSNMTVATATSGAATFGLTPHVDYTAGTKPVATVVRDINGDGLPDVIVTNASSNTVSVYLGNGDGTLQSQATYATGSSPTGLVVGDFNRDGILDLAVANSGSNTVSVLLGNGNGTFATQITYATGSGPQGLVAGDFNNDGNLDLVSVNTGANTVSLLLGSSTGVFGAKTDFSVGSSPYRATAASFNNNGNLDLAVTNGSANTVSILVGNGAGSFATHVDYATGTYPFGVATADINGDGKPDLVVANGNGPSVSVLLGNGDNTFQAQTAYPCVINPREVAIADINGDGYLDVAVGSYSGAQQFSILFGNGNGTLQSAVSYAGNYSPQSIALADLNGDGRIDVVTGDYLYTEISVLLGALTLTGAATPVSVYGNSTHAVNATYSGDSVYPRSTSNAVMLNSTTVPDFTIASATPSQTIAPGQTANYTISLTPQNAFTGTVALSCSGLPLGYTCGFAPASPTLNATQATSTMTISPTQSASIPPLSNGEINLASLSSLRPLRHSAAWLLSSMTLFLLVITRIASARRHLGRIACVIAFSSVCLLQGCGNAPFAPPLSTTYSVIVTGTSGTLKHSTTVTLIVTAAE